MYAATLYCIDAIDCGAAFEVFSMEPDHGVTHCRFCGSELCDIPSPPQSAEPDGLIVREVEVTVIHGPWEPVWPLGWSLGRVVAQAPIHVENLDWSGEPVLVRRRRDAGVLVGLDDLARLTEAVAVEVRIRDHPPDDDWTCDLPALGAWSRDFGLDAALCGLTVSVRRRLRKLLHSHPRERRELLPLVLRLWVADQQGRLSKLLRDSAVNQL